MRWSRTVFAILKVGPWLTFALREALYGLDAIANALGLMSPGEERLPDVMERLMLARPSDWAGYCAGDAAEQRVHRHFGYSDRIRYFWPEAAAQGAVDALLTRLGDAPVPTPLVNQFLGWLTPIGREHAVSTRPRDLILASIQQVLTNYDAACHAGA